MGVTGLEHSAKTPGKTGNPTTRVAECGAQRAPNGQFNHDLQQLIDAWNDLPHAVRADILARFKTASGDRGEAYDPQGPARAGRRRGPNARGAVLFLGCIDHTK